MTIWPVEAAHIQTNSQFDCTFVWPSTNLPKLMRIHLFTTTTTSTHNLFVSHFVYDLKSVLFAFSDPHQRHQIPIIGIRSSACSFVIHFVFIISMWHSIQSINLIWKFMDYSTETPLWLLLQVSPIKNERDIVVLLLLTFRDITALKQPIEQEDAKGGEFYSNLFALKRIE